MGFDDQYQVLMNIICCYCQHKMSGVSMTSGELITYQQACRTMDQMMRFQELSFMKVVREAEEALGIEKEDSNVDGKPS